MFNSVHILPAGGLYFSILSLCIFSPRASLRNSLLFYVICQKAYISHESSMTNWLGNILKTRDYWKICLCNTVFSTVKPGCLISSFPSMKTFWGTLSIGYIKWKTEWGDWQNVFFFRVLYSDVSYIWQFVKNTSYQNKVILPMWST